MNDTRNQILDAVENYLDKNPGLGFSLDKIAKLAKVSKGGLLYHFQSKQELFEALIERYIANFNNAIQLLMKTEKIPYSKAYISISLEPKAIKSIRAVIAVAAVDEGLLKVFKKAYIDWEKHLHQDLKNLEQAQTLQLLIDGYLLSCAGNLKNIDPKLIIKITNKLL